MNIDLWPTQVLVHDAKWGLLHARAYPPSLNNRKAYRATYGVVSWFALLERGRQRNQRHHGHRLPLLRLLADVDRLRGEGLEGGAEAGEHVALLVLLVILLHDSALPET